MRTPRAPRIPKMPKITAPKLPRTIASTSNVRDYSRFSSKTGKVTWVKPHKTNRYF